MAPKAPQRRELSRNKRGRRRDRTGWLTKQDSNSGIPVLKLSFELSGEIPTNSRFLRPGDVSRTSCRHWPLRLSGESNGRMSVIGATADKGRFLPELVRP